MNIDDLKARSRDSRSGVRACLFRNVAFALTVFALAAGCSNHRLEAVAVAETSGKPSAPARISVAWYAASLTVAVEFMRPAEQTVVRVRGIGGLEITPQIRELADTEPGRIVELAVPFTAPTGHTKNTPPGIAVSVRVRTGDQELVTVRSFTWPGVTSLDGFRKASEPDEQVRSGPDGRKIRVLPAR